MAQGSVAPAPTTKSTAAPSPATPQVTHLPGGTVDGKAFEGASVDEVLVSVSGTTNMSPRAQSGKDEDAVFTHDDIVTVQLDMKCVGINFVVGKNGRLQRIAKLAPVASTDATIVDVIRRDPTMKIRA